MAKFPEMGSTELSFTLNALGGFFILKLLEEEPQVNLDSASVMSDALQFVMVGVLWQLFIISCCI